MFVDIIIINLNAEYYLCMNPQNALTKADKDKKEKLLNSAIDGIK